MKSKIVCAALCISLASLTACGTTDQFSEELSKAQQEQEELLDEAKQKQDELLNSLTGKESEAPSEEPQETESVTEPPAESETAAPEQEGQTEDTESEDAEKEIASGAHEIDGAKFFFSKSVNNDVTGRWRISTVNTSMSAEEYALDYYKEMFSSDDEVHGIVNFALNTTAKITVPAASLNVTIYEYVEDEEHDAKELFTGMELAEYSIDIETGEIKKISE